MFRLVELRQVEVLSTSPSMASKVLLAKALKPVRQPPLDALEVVERVKSWTELLAWCRYEQNMVTVTKPMCHVMELQVQLVARRMPLMVGLVEMVELGYAVATILERTYSNDADMLRLLQLRQLQLLLGYMEEGRDPKRSLQQNLQQNGRTDLVERDCVVALEKKERTSPWVQQRHRVTREMLVLHRQHFLKMSAYWEDLRRCRSPQDLQ
jgi:hypothetical protein